MHRVRLVDGDGASMHGIGGLLVIDVAGRDPPGPRDHIRVTLLIVKMRLREIARIPFDDDAIESWLVGIAEQHGLLHPAFLTGPLDVLGQDGGNMGGIGRWARGVVDGCLGALRMSDPGRNGGADGRGDGHTQNRHSDETHTRLLCVNGWQRWAAGARTATITPAALRARADYDSGGRRVNRRIAESAIRRGRRRP